MPSEPFAAHATLGRVLDPLAGRTGQLEKRYKPSDVLQVGLPHAFHFMADPLAPELSDIFPVALNGVARKWVGKLRTPASSGDTNVDLVLDGTVLSTLTISAGDDYSAISLSRPTPLGSSLQCDLTDVGTGALGLVCVVVVIAAVQ